MVTCSKLVIKHVDLQIRGRINEIDFIYYITLYAEKFNLFGCVQVVDDNLLKISIEGTEENILLFWNKINTGILQSYISFKQYKEGILTDYRNFAVVKPKNKIKKKILDFQPYSGNIFLSFRNFLH